jgi:hypothetical protein
VGAHACQEPPIQRKLLSSARICMHHHQITDQTHLQHYFVFFLNEIPCSLLPLDHNTQPNIINKNVPPKTEVTNPFRISTQALPNPKSIDEMGSLTKDLYPPYIIPVLPGKVKYHEKHQCNSTWKQECQGHGGSDQGDAAVCKESQ